MTPDGGGEPPGLGCAFFEGLDYRYVPVEGGQALELAVTDELRGPAGSVHGALVALLIDVAGAFCLAHASGRVVATASASTQYLAAGRVGPLRATAKALRISDTTGVAEVLVVDVGKDHRLLAAALLSVGFLRGDTFDRRVS